MNYGMRVDKVNELRNTLLDVIGWVFKILLLKELISLYLPYKIYEGYSTQFFVIKIFMFDLSTFLIFLTFKVLSYFFKESTTFFLWGASIKYVL